MVYVRLPVVKGHQQSLCQLWYLQYAVIMPTINCYGRRSSSSSPFCSGCCIVFLPRVPPEYYIMTAMFALLVKVHHNILVSPLEMLHANWESYGSGAVGKCAGLQMLGVPG